MDASPIPSNPFGSPGMNDSPAKNVASSPGIKAESAGNGNNSNAISSVGATSSGHITNSRSPAAATASASASAVASNSKKVLDKRRLNDLAKEVDPMLQMDEDVEELLMQIADDFIDSVVSSSCDLAKHRKSSTLETKDVQLVLERNYGMWIPGFGSDELRPYKKAYVTEAHKQRMGLIKKSLKKF